MLFLYDFSSDRVAETCEDCDPERLLREPFRLYGGESLETQDKPFKTYDELLQKLTRDKKMEIVNREFAISLLKKYSYFDLISGYKAPFKRDNGDYKIHTCIEDVYALYKFDDNLRALLLRYILKIEKHVKSLISYAFCENNGEEQQHYLNVTKYNYTVENQVKINELVSRLAGIVNDPKNYKYIRHQRDKHNNIPLWVMMKALTLGTVSKMYSFLPQSVQCKVSVEFENVNESMLVQMLDLLARVRNVCAHNERLYDYRYMNGTIDDTAIHEKLAITKRKGQFVKGKKDLFAVIIVFKYLLEDKDFSEFVFELERLIDGLFHETSILQRGQMYKYMGFPQNWQEIKTL